MSVSHLPSLAVTPNAQSSIPLAARAIARSPLRTRAPAQQEKENSHALVLKKMIGTTSNSSSSLAAHAPSRSIAFCAGAAVCVAHVDEKLKITHKYFLRARPNASATTTASQIPSAAQDARSRTAASLREQGIGSPTIDSPGKNDDSKTWSARERVKAATTISFSPDGKFLAVGETGYNPRVLIYSMAPDGSNDKAPIAILGEHAFGVQCVAFSPCSRWLASIGTMNDGFVYIWSMPSSRNGTVKLHSSNKCTSLVRDIAWMGKSLITVGLRHVKVWKVEEDIGSPQVQRQSLQQFFEKLNISKTKIPTTNTTPRTTGPIVLNGRNALLGVMSDNMFTSVVAIANDKALVSTEKGEICLLDDTCQRFSKLMSAEFGVSCISVDPEKRFAWVAGRQGSIKTIAIQNIVSPPTPPESPASRAGSPVLPSGCKPADVIAMTALGNHLFTIDSNRTLKVIRLTNVDTMLTPDSVVNEFAAHKNSVQGVKLMPHSEVVTAEFFTYSACGTILFWNAEGACQLEMNVEVEQPKDSIDDFTNELKVVEVTQSGKSFVTGDKLGVLRVIDAKTRKCEYAVKAHSGEVMDLAVFDSEQATIIASCARDRTVQVFAKIKNKKHDTWGLTQTLEDHTASVSRVRFMEGGSKLLSCSVDRTIVVRELALRFDSEGVVSVLAFLPVRTITLKSAALHMTPCSDPGAALLVSTAGRQIHRFDVSSGRELHSFKATDETGTDSVVLDALTLGVENPQDSKSRLLAGISTTDKSIRLYDTAGNFIDKEWGHTEGVSDLVMFEAKNSDDKDTTTTTLVSTGTDGTVMMWNFVPKPSEEPARELNTPNAKDMTATQAPLRKVLSKADLLELSRRSPEKELASPESSKPQDDEALKSRRFSRLETPQLRAEIASKINRSASPTKPHHSSVRSPSPAKGSRPGSPTKPARKRMSLTTMMKSNNTTPTPTLNIRPPSRPPSRILSPSASPKAQSFSDVQTDTETSYNAGTARRKTKALVNRERSASPELKTSPAIKPVRRPSFGSSSRPSSIVRPTLTRETSDAVNANALAEQLSRTLKLFRRRIEGSQAALKPETKKELENELNLTLKCIGAATATDPQMLSPAAPGTPRTPESTRESGRSEDAMLPLLNMFSERLLEMVESKMNSPSSSPKKSDIETFAQQESKTT